MNIINVCYDFHHDKRFKYIRPRSATAYLLIVMRKNIIFYNESGSESIKPYSIALFDKNYSCGFVADSEVYISDWVDFNLTESEAKLFLNKIVLNKFIETKNAAECSELLRMMQKELLSANANRTETMELFLKMLFLKIEEYCENCEKKEAYYAEILKIRSDIYSNPSVKYTVEMLAEKLHISKHYFHHLYKKFFDVPPVTDIINSRIEHAKRLLRSTDYSVKEIAEILGYSTDTQFMKQFKGVTEMSASEYRKKATV